MFYSERCIPTRARFASLGHVTFSERSILVPLFFAVAVRYDGVESSTTDLELGEVPDTSTSTMGVLSTLLAWNAADPVSAEESARNQRVCTDYQHNRNYVRQR